MSKKRNPKDFLLGIVLVLLLGCLAYGISALLQGEVTEGTVTVKSGDSEITALSNTVAEYRKSGSVADFARFEIPQDAKAFPVIKMDKGIILVTSQDPYSDMSYTIYKEDGSELYYRSSFFSYPEENGTYYIVIDTSWGTDEHHFTTQHGFTLVMNE